MRHLRVGINSEWNEMRQSFPQSAVKKDLESNLHPVCKESVNARPGQVKRRFCYVAGV
jgi:hypothetical protein